MALASGADTYKLKYGHRSHNQPVIQVGTDKAYITSQNHGFAVDNNTLGNDWEPLFININDQTNEGMKHKTKPFFSTQFHPEASGGPTDTDYLFDVFLENIERSQHKSRIKSQNPLTAKGTKREEIARWAILAQWPDCTGGLLCKIRKEFNINILSLCASRKLNVLCG